MGKCFINEDIEFDIIYSDNERNVIKVDNRKEIFFEVYESIIDDKKIVLEKIGEFGGLPIVTVEFKQNGKIYTCEALLEDDNKNQLVVNEDNLYFLRDEKNLKNNIYVEKTEVETTSGTDVVAETKLNIQHTYDEKIKEYEDKKFTFLEDIENQFQEKINLLKDDIGEKLDTFFEKLDKKKEEIISEKLDEVTSEIDNKFELLKTELQNVEEFSKNNINSILEKKVTDIDSSVNNFLEDLTKTYKDRFKDSDKKSVGNYLNLKSLTEKYNKNKEDTDNKIKDLFDLKNKLLEQDDLIIKNKELLEFINDEFNTINNKFLYLNEKENEKYNELLAAVSKKDVVEYKTILKEKIQDVELGLVKEELRDEISENFRNEITSLKRYAEMSSGGGTNAVQYANGGTMNGDLTVNGTMKADTIIATTLLSAVTLDIGFELSGFNVTGSISANGDITGNRVIAINTLSANGNLYPQTIATRGQVIVANDDGNLIFGHGEKIHLEIRNDEGSDISAGTPVYSKGEIGGSERILVGKADANDSTKMPAIGIAETTLNTTDAKDGFAIINGVYNENISGFTNLIEGQNLYVSSAGGLTNVKPTGVNNLIQNIGTVLKVGGGGSILQGMKVSSIDRTNDIPNLSAKAIFYGQGDYYVQQSLSAAIFDSTRVNIGSSSVSACSVSACNIHSTEIFEGGNRVCTTESDTLADVTGRGATTSTDTTFNGKLSVGSENVCAFNVQNTITPTFRVNTVNTTIGMGVTPSTNNNQDGILQVGGGICSCSLTACHSFVKNLSTADLHVCNGMILESGSDQVHFRNNAIVFEDISENVQIRHTCKTGHGIAVCNFSIVAAQNNGFGGRGGNLILSGGCGIGSGSCGGNICINTGEGDIRDGDIYLMSNKGGSVHQGEVYANIPLNATSLSAGDDIRVNGQLLGGISQNKICNSSFTLDDSDNGKNIFIDTTSGSVNVTVNCMTSGFATRFIYEGGSNPISFISGAGLSGLNSYLGRTQMNVIHSQADINFRSERYAFLGGNLA